jgi:hypothetical protein
VSRTCSANGRKEERIEDTGSKARKEADHLEAQEVVCWTILKYMLPSCGT